MVVCAPTGSGKTVVFEMAIVQLLMELDDKNYKGDFKIIYSMYFIILPILYHILFCILNYDSARR